MALVVHTVALLDGPDLAARALAIVDIGERLRVETAADGFLNVQTDAGQAGYIPAAVCAPLAHADPPLTRAIQPTALYRRPSPGAQFVAPWIVPPGETLDVIGREAQFLRIRRSNGQTGYVPEMVCSAPVLGGGLYPTAQARQPVALYSTPTPGGQFGAEWIVRPDEPLLVLGNQAGFLLVQRDNGRIGYTPAALCGDAAPDQLLKAGPLDLGWIALGAGWAWVDLIGLANALQRANPLFPALAPYAMLAVTLAVAVLLWLGSRRRLAARSFALGALLAAALVQL